MKLVKLSLIVCGSLGIIFLGACGNNNQVKQTENNQSVSTSTTKQSSVSDSPTNKTDKSSNHDHSVSKGGQVVETGKYHLEFLAGKEANGTHLDFYLQTGDNHQTVPNAKVTAQVQLPDGKQTNIPFTYDAPGEHYKSMLNETISGQYQIKITADIQGETVNGRFNFNR